MMLSTSFATMSSSPLAIASGTGSTDAPPVFDALLVEAGGGVAVDPGLPPAVGGTPRGVPPTVDRQIDAPSGIGLPLLAGRQPLQLPITSRLPVITVVPTAAPGQPALPTPTPPSSSTKVIAQPSSPWADRQVPVAVTASTIGRGDTAEETGTDAESGNHPSADDPADRGPDGATPAPAAMLVARPLDPSAGIAIPPASTATPPISTIAETSPTPQPISQTAPQPTTAIVLPPAEQSATPRAAGAIALPTGLPATSPASPGSAAAAVAQSHIAAADAPAAPIVQPGSPSRAGVTTQAVAPDARPAVVVMTTRDPAIPVTAAVVNHSGGRAEAPAPIASIPNEQLAAAPQRETAAPITQGSAIQVFGAAIAAARHSERAASDDRAIDPATLRPIADAAHPIIAATGGAQQAPLDMRQERWPHAMIDRIEYLRDTAAAATASAADTRIRLVPDALGAIDVSITRDGDTVAVRFQAEHAATRALLQDSQARLADIAESRGLRLSGSSVDAGSTLGSGSSGAGQQQRTPQPQPLPSAPRRASTGSSAAADDADADRVA